MPRSPPHSATKGSRNESSESHGSSHRVKKHRSFSRSNRESDREHKRKHDRHSHRIRLDSSNESYTSRSSSRSSYGKRRSRAHGRHHDRRELRRSRSRERHHRYRKGHHDEHKSRERRDSSRHSRRIPEKHTSGGSNSIGRDAHLSSSTDAETSQNREGKDSILLSLVGDGKEASLGMLNNEFRELNYSRAYGIDVSNFSFAQDDILKVELPRENKQLSTYEKRQRIKEEIAKYPERFWKCKKCESMNYLSSYQCSRCQQLRNANR
ncbi:hypothetical protein BgAZ_103010 [Babesia gibsoni]|uniref:RanBP2-type domain-containing protein n=1 Tax=Babesia gibsoni TaxID=33632 RepID=A0AAD8PFP7_BABGI|nr:hypothetical protein BgAZ_103010 [Babesia gibsoni]